MVLSYTEDELNIIFNNPDFLSNYDTYKTNNLKKVNDLQIFLDSFKTNKNYHKISINKNKKVKRDAVNYPGPLFNHATRVLPVWSVGVRNLIPRGALGQVFCYKYE